MYAVKAIYDGINFKPKQPISLIGAYEVVITFLEPVAEGVVCAEQTKKRLRSEIFGCLKGKISISDDFNDPIEELKEYMECHKDEHRETDIKFEI